MNTNKYEFCAKVKTWMADSARKEHWLINHAPTTRKTLTYIRNGYYIPSERMKNCLEAAMRSYELRKKV